MLERIVLRLDLDVKAEAEFFAYYQSLPRGRRQEFMRNRLRIGEALPESCAGAGVRPQSQDYSAPARRESQVVPASPPAAPTSTDRLDRSVQSTESSAPSPVTQPAQDFSQPGSALLSEQSRQPVASKSEGKSVGSTLLKNLIPLASSAAVSHGN